MMMKKWLSILCLLPAPGFAEAAFTCSFNVECYEQEACSSADFSIGVNEADKEIATDFGDLRIVAIRELKDAVTVFANGSGGVYLLSVTEDGARFTAHVGDKPEAITYSGTCEGAF